MNRLIAAALVCLAVAAPASADVVDAGANGFSLKITADVNAPASRVFRALSEQIGQWWDPAHSFSGDGSNLTIDPHVGGCFCEKLTHGGVQHMVVTHVDAPHVLTMNGGLGPLGSMGVAGAMSWTLEERGGRTTLQLIYNVGGYTPGGFSTLAPLVDAVLSDQVKRLKTFAETGRPN